MKAGRAVIGAIAFWLCTGAQAADTPDFKTAHTVAILSLLGDTVQQYDGKPVATPGANFDDLSEHAMAAQIGTDLPGVTVVRVGGPRDVLLQQMYPRTGFGDVGLKNVQRELRGWAAAHTADYIVLVRKVVGVAEGAISWTLFGIGTSGGTYAFLNITVLDGKSLRVVTDMSVRDVRWGSLKIRRAPRTDAGTPPDPDG